MAEPTPKRIGNYEVIKRLAVGGMGEIFLARQVGIGGFERLVVLKTMLQSIAPDRQSVDQFFDEARLAATLNHPNIVSIYELGRHDEIYFIAMEHIAGIDLFALMRLLRKARVYVPPRIGATVLRDAALALDYAHRATDMRGQPLNIIHRDVSPQNIMVRLDGGVKVVDFGIARAANRFSQTVGDVVKGKLLYMSPEQVRGQTLTSASDQFSLGVVGWELFALKSLFKGDSPAQVMINVANQEVTPLSEVRRKFSPEMSAIVQRMLEREPDARYRSCAEVARAAQDFLDASGGSADHELAAMVKQVGGAVIAERVDLGAAADDPARPADAGSTVICPKCGASAARGTKFCSGCGTSLAAPGGDSGRSVKSGRGGSDRLPSLDLVEISGAAARADVLQDTETVRDTEMAMTVGGAVVIRDGGHNVIDFGDGPESEIELGEISQILRIGPREPAFVARQADLDFLRQQFDAALGGRARAVLLLGEEGIGKSRLLAELARSSRNLDRVVARAVCLRRGAPLALDLFRQWVIAIASAPVLRKGRRCDCGYSVASALAGVAEEDVPEPLRRRLAQLFDGETFEVASQPLEHGQRQVAALLSFFERVAARSPLLLLAEDIHGADQMSVDLLQKMTERLPDARLCLVATATPVRVEQLGRGFEVRQLSPLGVAELRHLAQNTLALSSLPEEIDSQLPQLHGNPTIAVQLMRRFAAPTAAEQAGALSRGKPALPTVRSVRDVVALLMSQLSPDAAEVIGAAALLGEVFSTVALGRVFPTAGESLQIALHDALQLGMIESHDGSPQELRFAQGSFRRAVLALLDETRARRLRGLVAPVRQAPELLPAHERCELLGLIALVAEPARVDAVRQLEVTAAAMVQRGLLGPAIEMLGRAVDAGLRLLLDERTLADEQ
ncbi:MAG: protein kinase, partial [Deltaproteobacteria bacterium]|nr:protein kinase [Deltaproteobacteria bacterium]